MDHSDTLHLDHAGNHPIDHAGQNQIDQAGSRLLVVRDLLHYLSGLAGGLGEEEGIRFGTPAQPVRSILLCWMANLAAIRQAAEIGADLIIAHESVLFPYTILERSGPPDFLSWQVNRNRIDLLTRHQISLVRAHITLDRFCIFDDFAAKLELGDPVVSKPGFVKIYEIEPTPYGALIEHVKDKLHLACLRATPGDKTRVIRQIGLPWGGLGLIVNTSYMQSLLHEGCDCLIAGETDNYGFHFATDSGVDLIETSHEVSENPGLEHFGQVLAAAFPQLHVSFYENKPPFAYE